MSSSDLEKETQRLAAAMLGQQLVPITDLEKLEERLVEGQEVILTFEGHQWVANGLKDGRVLFYDPARRETKTGQEFPEGDLPAHRGEEQGLFSLDLEELLDWWEEDRVKTSHLA